MAVPTFRAAKGHVALPPPGREDTADGDTMRVELPFRLVSVDTPEAPKVGGAEPLAQRRLEAAVEALRGLSGDHGVPADFADYFAPRVAGGGAARHYAAAAKATQRLRALRDAVAPGPDGRGGGLAVIPAGEVVDSNGRMLAYLARHLDRTRAIPLDAPERRTFNHTMVAEGWAACFPIWPSFPSSRADFLGFLDAARSAWRSSAGNWEGENQGTLLTGYEFRALIKVGTASLEGVSQGRGLPRRPATAADHLAVFRRICVDREGRDHGRFGFVGVGHGDRIWTWDEDAVPALRAYLRGAG